MKEAQENNVFILASPRETESLNSIGGHMGKYQGNRLNKQVGVGAGRQRERDINVREIHRLVTSRTCPIPGWA